MAPASFIPISNKVCVMEASSRLGASLVARLLGRGYVVHAAVQGQLDELEKYMKVWDEDEKMKVKVFKADLFDFHSIVDALRGCSGLFYNFEPPRDHSIYDEHMMEVEVRATHNVFEASAHVGTIDKIVFTSSITAVVWRHDRSSTSSNLDEKHWSDISFCRKFKLWHALSKTISEKSSRALAMDRGLNMVTVNAGLILSNDLSITNPYLKGAAEMYEDGVFVATDLKFLVDAHICVFEDIAAYGRYLCFNSVINHAEVALQVTKIIAPWASPQIQSFEGEDKMIQQNISNKKLNELMANFETELSQES
ncbi:Cinnamoyl-CoA reductase-like SNL6-like protein [Drosera capensis]